MINGDKIRSLPNAELAQELAYNVVFHHGDHFCLGECPEPYDSCVSCILAWLEKEVSK